MTAVGSLPATGESVKKLFVPLSVHQKGGGSDAVHDDRTGRLAGSNHHCGCGTPHRKSDSDPEHRVQAVHDALESSKQKEITALSNPE